MGRTREGRRKAIEFLDYVESTALRVERVTEADEVQAFALVRAHADKTYSMCDALSFAVMERTGITDVIACDSHFRSYGRFNVLV